MLAFSRQRTIIRQSLFFDTDMKRTHVGGGGGGSGVEHPPAHPPLLIILRLQDPPALFFYPISSTPPPPPVKNPAHAPVMYYDCGNYNRPKIVVELVTQLGCV